MEIKANTNEKQEMRLVKSRSTKAVTKVEALVINDGASSLMAANMLKDLTGIEKAIKKQESKIADPIKLALKEAKNFFGPIYDKVHSSKLLLKEKILDYDKKIEKRKEKIAEKVEQKVKDGKMSIKKAATTLEKAEDLSANIVKRKVKEVVVVNQKLVPKEYWVLDMVNIRKCALAGVKIPGVEVKEKEIIVSGK